MGHSEITKTTGITGSTGSTGKVWKVETTATSDGNHPSTRLSLESVVTALVKRKTFMAKRATRPVYKNQHVTK